MANICSGSIKVVLPTEKRDEFLSHFCFEHGSDYYDYIKESKQQTNLSIYCVEEKLSANAKFVSLTFCFDCRWSVRSAQLDYMKDTETFITFETLFRKCDVRHFYLKDQEPGFEFEEQIDYHKDKMSDDINISLECRDYWPEAVDYMDLVDIEEEKEEN